jgi:large subunit ribosomal protein L6
MSRIGKLPVAIPAGVTVALDNGVITVKGPKGTLTQDYDAANITITIDGAVATLTRANDNKDVRAKHGLYRALLHNMVVGVTDGFTKKLVLAGVGYKAAKSGNKVTLNVGYSHPVDIFETADIKLEVASQTEVVVSGIDKTKVGQYAATVRSIRKPEPYHGYGIHYSDEVIERKEGKTAGK